ncbi:Lrp/AsnC family transcriptional regulator [Azohydromonas lata]|uniref:Lrp/AsnC family transcriptional regulator n=1 Tax=Azohydromonas lata TaxID=45677 RepID=A0ABU5IEG7_9BURK|nr:Lrp/AsnC family transcriptional regulator [Azohydromonas lata]MDZ5457510.1 Lrp/AsnC family transcriptional regulator [Azohydromonas lata]
MKLDPYDRALLAALQDDARTPQSALGEQVSLSTAAVNRRLKALAGEGVIERFSAQLNPKALGYDLTVVVEVKVESERADLLDQMQRSFAACPQVQQCYYVAGDCDFVLIFLVRDMEQYVALTRKLFFESHNVKTFKTLVAMNRVKTGATVPVDAA